jgi:hypothetical protein
VYLISWPDWLFKEYRFIPTLLTGKGRSGQRHFYQFQREAKQFCTPLDASGWKWPHLKKGKEPHWQIMVWPQTLAFVLDVSVFCVVSHKNHFFLAGKEYLVEVE